jgi:hypothetical protein
LVLWRRGVTGDPRDYGVRHAKQLVAEALDSVVPSSTTDAIADGAWVDSTPRIPLRWAAVGQASVGDAIRLANALERTACSDVPHALFAATARAGGRAGSSALVAGTQRARTPRSPGGGHSVCARPVQALAALASAAVIRAR